MFQSRHGRDHAVSFGVRGGRADRGIQGGRLPQALFPLFPSGEARVYGEEVSRGLPKAQPQDQAAQWVPAVYGEQGGKRSGLQVQDEDGQEVRLLASGPDGARKGHDGFHHSTRPYFQVASDAFWH